MTIGGCRLLVVAGKADGGTGLGGPEEEVVDGCRTSGIVVDGVGLVVDVVTGGAGHICAGVENVGDGGAVGPGAQDYGAGDYAGTFESGGRVSQFVRAGLGRDVAEPDRVGNAQVGDLLVAGELGGSGACGILDAETGSGAVAVEGDGAVVAAFAEAARTDDGVRDVADSDLVGIGCP